MINNIKIFIEKILFIILPILKNVYSKLLLTSIAIYKKIEFLYKKNKKKFNLIVACSNACRFECKAESRLVHD